MPTGDITILSALHSVFLFTISSICAIWLSVKSSAFTTTSTLSDKIVTTASENPLAANRFSVAVSFSLISVILAAGETDKAVLKKLKKLSDERKYQSDKHGWSSIRLAVVDLDTHKVHTNRMGDSLKNILQPLV